MGIHFSFLLRRWQVPTHESSRPSTAGLYTYLYESASGPVGRSRLGVGAGPLPEVP